VAAVLALALHSAAALASDTDAHANFGAAIELFALAGEDTDYVLEEFRYRGLGGATRAGYFAGTLSAQGNVQGSEIKLARDDERYAIDALATSLHAGIRSPTIGYIGAWAGFSFHQPLDEIEFSQVMWGLDAQRYFSRSTLWVQVGLVEPWDDRMRLAWNDAAFVRGGLRFFPTPDVKLEASGGLLAGDEYMSPAKYQHFTFWKLGAEHRPEGEPVSVFAELHGHHADEPGFIYTQIAGLVGVRFLIGRESLLSHDRTGPSLDVLDPAYISIAFNH
jgi:hypothetical protein